MSQETLHEITRRSIYVTKNEETSLSWNNSMLTVRTDKGISFLELSYDLESSEKKIDWLETSICCPKTSPASSLFPTRYLKSEIRNVDMMQMIIDPALWPHNPQLMNELANITAFEFSPPGFIPNNNLVIATLNNVGNVEIFRLKRNMWISLFNLSSHVKKPSIKNYHFPLTQLKMMVDTVESSAICWGQHINVDGSCYFVTAQRNSDIIFWSLKYCETEIKHEVINIIHSGISEIISIVFIHKHKSEFLLICSNILGQIFALSCEFEDDKLKLTQSAPLWPHKDRMITKYMQYAMIDDKIILLSNKHRHLLVQMFDENCKVLSEYVNNINDFRITSITKNKDEFYVGTIDTKAYRIELKVTDTNLSVQLTSLYFRDAYPNHELYGFCVSENNLIYVLVLIDRKIQHRKNQTTIEIVCLCKETSCHQKEISMLLNNPTKKLTNMCDCIELLRYKTMKLRVLPTIDYVILYAEADQDLYKLKVYLILVILYNNLEKITKNGSKNLLPETSVKKIREAISVTHAINVINDLYETHQSSNMLNNFQMETLDGAKKYLLYYCQKYEKNVSEFVIVDKLNISNCDIKHICQCCDETIKGFSCKNQHLNIFCSLTFTPILSDNYLVCKYCKVTARQELYSEKPLCVFCDSYLNFSFE